MEISFRCSVMSGAERVRRNCAGLRLLETSIDPNGKAHARRRTGNPGMCLAAPEQGFGRPYFSIQKEQGMNWDRVEGNWRQLKGKVKEQWGKLTDDQLDEVAGRRDQLVGLVQEKYGIERDRAEREVDGWVSKLN
jgi:uncharacterized protein YjbJ (UPF0337 family)